MSSSSMAETDQNLRIAMFPWLAFGHIIPYLELAKLIAQRGHRIYFISTTRNIQRLPKLPQNLTPLIDFVSLSLPHDPLLPADAEATIDVPPPQVQFLKRAYDGLKEPLSQFLATAKPDWIFYDFSPHWLPPITSSFGISGAYFSIFNASCLTFCCSPIDQDGRRNPEDYVMPPKWITFPSKVAFRLYQAKDFVTDNVSLNESGVSDIDRMISVLSGCQVLLIRSSMLIEGNYINLLAEKIYSKHVLPVGLLPPVSNVQVAENDEEDQTWKDIKQWLNKQEKQSVVYIAFGSEATPSQKDLNELALGIELSGLPFFWTLRKQATSESCVDSLELPDGFEERTKGRGIVWTTWTPQVKILSHESIGGFLTHAGWSSIIEALCYGLPLVIFPIMTSQGLLARFIEEEVKAGIEIARDEEDGSFTRDSVASTLKKVFKGEEGKDFRNKAKELRLVFGDVKLQESYIDKLLAHLLEQKPASN